MQLSLTAKSWGSAFSGQTRRRAEVYRKLFCAPASMTGQKRSRISCRAEITGKKIAVIGASRGLGLELVKQFLAKGNEVHGTARSSSSALSKLSDKIQVGQLDVADPKSIQAWAKKLRNEFGALDYAIVVAGVVDGYAGLEDTSEEKMLYCFKTNTVGPLLIAQALVDNELLESGSVLANMTSKMGSLADNGSGGTYAYRASKSALNQVTKSLSIDLEPRGITVTLLHPGWVRTDITGGSGLIDADQSVSGLISVLESDLPLHGHWYDYKHEEIPW